MKVYTYSEARQRLSRLLDEAREGGEIRIKRRDGSEFTVRPVRPGDPLSTCPAWIAASGAMSFWQRSVSRGSVSRVAAASSRFTRSLSRSLGQHRLQCLGRGQAGGNLRSGPGSG